MMPDDRRKVPNPFMVARRSASLTVELRPEDVLQLRPRWSRADAAQFLMTHRTAIAASILSSGTGAVLAMNEAEEQCPGPMN
jgi:hypothetical protein